MSTVSIIESSAYPLAVLGVGLTSPFGVTARDHAFFLRARLVPTMPPPFVDSEGELVTAHYCRWLGARTPIAERMERMALTALAAAVAPCIEQFESGWDVALVVESERIGLGEDALLGVRSAAQTILSGKRARYSVFRGAAGCQRALIALAGRIAQGESSIGCVLAADSFLSLEPLAEESRVPVVWRSQPAPLSEAAAALVLTDPRRCSGVAKPIGKLLYQAVARGTACDTNDELVDGYALTHLLREMPDLGGAVPAVFGPKGCDALRLREWGLASARNARRFCEPYSMHDLESIVGRVGAASGAAHLAYALACLHYRTAHPTFGRDVVALSWALSRDGWRGVSLVQGGLS